MNAQVHVVMGPEEASVITTALGMLLTVVEHDVETWQDSSETSKDELMTMLSVKFCAEGMFESLTQLLEEVGGGN